MGAEKVMEAIGIIESGWHESGKQDDNMAKVYRSATKENIKDYEKARSKR